MIRSKLKLLLQGENDQSLLTFIDEAVNKELQKAIIELHYSQELSLLYILQNDVDRAKYYIENSIHNFIQVIQIYQSKIYHFCNIFKVSKLMNKNNQKIFFYYLIPPISFFLFFQFLLIFLFTFFWS